MATPIPIQNIYFLLCYAWNQLEEKDVVEINPEDSTALQDLFARVLAGGVQYLIRRGFDRLTSPPCPDRSSKRSLSNLDRTCQTASSQIAPTPTNTNVV